MVTKMEKKIFISTLNIIELKKKLKIKNKIYIYIYIYILYKVHDILFHSNIIMQ